MGSPSLPVLSGIPQGSILGPLFIIYINDIPDRITHSTALYFADDTKLLRHISSFNDRKLLQEDLTSIEGWCDEWHLNLNANKCVALEFSSEHDPVVYSLGSQQMSMSQCHWDLGILVCITLSWANHYSKLCSSAYGSLYMIRRNASSVTLSERKLYLSLARCHLSYCSQLWRPYLIKDIELLERGQKRATKDRFLSLGPPPLVYWFELLDIMFLVHTLKNPPDNCDIYDHITFTNFDERSTRFSPAHHLQSKHCRTSYGRHFYFNRIVRLWNDCILQTERSIYRTQCNPVQYAIFIYMFIYFNISTTYGLKYINMYINIAYCTGLHCVLYIDLSVSEYTIKHHLMDFLWFHFEDNVDPNSSHTLKKFYVLVLSVTSLTHLQSHLVDVFLLLICCLFILFLYLLCYDNVSVLYWVTLCSVYFSLFYLL